MAVYSYYYGASAARGITVQAQSREIESLSIGAALKDLSSMHALKYSDQDGEMLSYLLSSGNHSILGTSYTESPKNSGYSRSAPCGLIYVSPTAFLTSQAGMLGKIINFVNFQKPTSATPAPLNGFPLNESGYSYHNSPSMLAPMVEGFLRVALSPNNNMLLLALPKGKTNEYVTARYAISEALNYLPEELRANIRFFTGLPVSENESDPLVGFDNAARFGANVVFCPNEFFARLKSHRTCIALDMDKPALQLGAFAQFITTSAAPAVSLSQIHDCIPGKVTYEALNKAAQRLKAGDYVTIGMLHAELSKVSSEKQELESQCYAMSQNYAALENKHTELTRQHNDLLQQYKAASRRSGRKKRGSRVLFWIILILCVLLLMALTAFGTYFITTHFIVDNDPAITPTATPAITATATVSPAEATEQPVVEATDAPETVADTQSDNNAETAAETQADDNAEAAAETQSDDNAEAAAETQSDDSTEAAAETQADDNAETAADTQADDNAETADEAQTDNNTDSENTSDTENTSDETTDSGLDDNAVG